MRKNIIRVGWFATRGVAALALVGLSWSLSTFGYCQQPQPTIACEFLNSGAVFIGTVISMRDEPPMNNGDVSPDGWIYTLTVQKRFRGPNSKTIEVYTENANARFPLEVGKQYLLFADRFHGRFEITSCGNSKLLSDATDSVKALEATVIPEDAVIEGHISFSGEVQSGGIVVALRGHPGTFTAVSNSDGWFRIHVPPGKYSAKIQEVAGRTITASNESVEDPDHIFARKGHCSGLQFFGSVQ